MFIERGFALKAPIEKLFDFLLNPETIMTCLPSAESVKLLDETTYECVVIREPFSSWVKRKVDVSP